jgi:dolichol kinase
VAPSHHTLTSPPLSLRHEFVRKALHLSAAVFPVAYSLGAQRNTLEMFLAIISAFAILTEALRRANATVGTAFERAFDSLIRQHERRSITGATWLAVSCLVAVVVLSRSAAIAALWCAAVGDPVATIAGRVWSTSGAAKSGENGGKTIVGTLACAAASFVGVWMLAGYSPATAAVIAAGAAAAEAMPTRIDDNVRVTSAAGVIAQLLA